MIPGMMVLSRPFSIPGRSSLSFSVRRERRVAHRRNPRRRHFRVPAPIRSVRNQERFRSSAGSGGSDIRKKPRRTTTPIGRLTESVPLGPAMNSVLPPPMSMTRAPPRVFPTAPSHVRRASSRAEMISTEIPAFAAAAKNSSRLDASRRPAVPHARYGTTPRASISLRNSRRVAIESRNSLSPIEPLSRRDFPRAVIRRRRRTGRSPPPSCAATSIRTVFVPTSIAARSLIRACTRLAFRRRCLSLLPLQYPDDAGAEQVCRCKEVCHNYKTYDSKEGTVNYIQPAEFLDIKSEPPFDRLKEGEKEEASRNTS